MLRFIIVFAVGFVSVFIVETLLGGAEIKSVIIISSFSAAFYFLGELVDMLSLSPRTGKNIRSKRYTLASFNDSIAKEIMKIRSDLASIRVKLKDYGGLIKHSEEFAKLFAMCCKYPDTFLCTYVLSSAPHAKPSDLYSGNIIIILDNDLNIDENQNFDFSATELRMLNSSKKHKLSIGMNVSFYLEDDQGKWSSSFANAKIVSVEENTNENSFYLTDYILTLELCHDEEYSFMTNPPEKKIRKVDISKNEYYRLFYEK